MPRSTATPPPEQPVVPLAPQPAPPTKPRPKSIALKRGYQPRVYKTFEDWQSDQKRDSRTPEQRGIKVGGSILWRHRANKIILTERATVLSIKDNTLTISIKDVKTRTVTVDIHEIVNSSDDRMSVTETVTPIAPVPLVKTPQIQ